PQSVNIFVLFSIRNLDIRVLSAFFCENLDPHVDILVRCLAVVVAIHLAVQNYGLRSGRQRLSLHLQLLLVWRRKRNPGTCPCLGWTENDGQHNCRNRHDREDAFPHSDLFSGCNVRRGASTAQTSAKGTTVDRRRPGHVELRAHATESTAQYNCTRTLSSYSN